MKEGLDKKSQVSLYIGQLDHIENTLREWEAHGHTPKDFEVFAKQKCHSDSGYFRNAIGHHYYGGGESFAMTT